MEKASKLIKYICALHRAWQFLQECSSPARQDPCSLGSAAVQFVTCALCLPGSEKIKTSPEKRNTSLTVFRAGDQGEDAERFGLRKHGVGWVCKTMERKTFFPYTFFFFFLLCYLLCYNQSLKCCNFTTVFSDFLEPFS